jgi:hypothetical protein
VPEREGLREGGGGRREGLTYLVEELTGVDPSPRCPALGHLDYREAERRVEGVFVAVGYRDLSTGLHAAYLPVETEQVSAPGSRVCVAWSPARGLLRTGSLKTRQLGSKLGRLRYCSYEEGLSVRQRLMDRRSACRAAVVLAVSVLAAVVFGAAASPAAAAPMCGRFEATIVGTSGADQIVGTPGNDVIAARGGADQIQGRGGLDLICAGRGKDQLSGGRGNDVLYGNRGGDELFGDRGGDGLDGGPGFDLGNGGAGGDLCTSVELARRCE